MVTAVFKNNNTERVRGLWQYDYGQVLRIQGLILPTAVEIDFSLQETGGESTSRVGITRDGVTDVVIPDSMLENGGATQNYSIYAFIYLTDETSGETIKKIIMSVTSRPKPEAFDAPEDAELFREAIAAVNKSAGRAETAEASAEAWAHGHVDYPERDEDNAKHYADESKKDAEETKKERTAVSELAEHIDAVAMQVNEDKTDTDQYKDQASTSAAKALQSEQAAKSSETAAMEAQAGAEAAEGQAELFAVQTEEDKNTVEQAKDVVMGISQEVVENRNYVQQSVGSFGLIHQQAVTDVNNAGQTQTERVEEAGTAQVSAVQEAVAEIIADREQISNNKNSIDSLKTDLGNISEAMESVLRFEYSELQIEITDGILDRWNNIRADGQQYKHVSIPVSSGERYRVSGYKYSSDYPAYLFRKNGAIVSYKNDVDLGKFTLEVLVPNNVDELVVNANIDANVEMMSPIKYLVESDVKGTVDKVNNICSYIYREFPFIKENGVYDTKDNLTSVGSHVSLKVKEGDVLRFTGYKYSSSYPEYFFKNNYKTVFYSNNETQGSIFTIEITIPKGVDELVCNSNENITLEKGYAEKYSSAYVLKPIEIPEIESGIITRWNDMVNAGVHVIVPVKSGDMYVAHLYKWGSDYPAIAFRDNAHNLLSYINTGSNGMTTSYEFTIPDGCAEIVLNSNSDAKFSLWEKHNTPSKPNSKWTGKKIVWFGTSIPEKSNYNAVIGYPEYTAKLLGATVMNEARGSSCARRGFTSKISANDPYGWTGMGYKSAFYNMGATIAEKNELVNNWDSKWKELVDSGHDITDSDRELALHYSHENIIPYYLNEGVDLWVFDHGYNDFGNGASDLDSDSSDFYNRSTYQGAMNTIIKMILEANPRAKILLLSHYETQQKKGLIEMQEEVAKAWNLPFCRICDSLGWAYDRQISSNGYWNNGFWVSSGGSLKTYRLTDIHMADGKHPNTDKSGKACMDIAHIIANYIDATISPTD